MPHEQIRAIAQQVADEMYGTENTEMAMRFATRFLAAITAKSAPSLWVNCITKEVTFNPNTVDIWLKYGHSVNAYFTHPTIEPAPTVDYEYDLSKCPNCGGSADNGHDRCYPPNPYYCKRCMKEEQTEPAKVDPRCTCDEHGACAWCWNGKRNDIEPAQDEKLRFALENCRLLAARHRKETWATLILGFCAEGGVAGSPLRDGDSK